jgi:hypothetical protein
MTGKSLTAIDPAGSSDSEVNRWRTQCSRGLFSEAYFEVGSSRMSRRWLILAASLFAGCSPASRVEVEYEQPQKTDANFANLDRVLAGIPKSGDTLLHEGLPSEFWEPELRERELNQKAILKLHGCAFYAEPIALDGTDAERLTALFSSKKSFRRYDGKKSCSGYYPEYCVEWKAGEAVTQALICLECREIKIFGPPGELHCDLSIEAEQGLSQLLSQYQKNRPTTKATK